MTDAPSTPTPDRDVVEEGSPLAPDRGAGRPATDDPYTEGESAATDEWFGQSVERDTALAERLVDEHGGDVAAAEAAFDEQATGAQEQEARRHGPPPGSEPA